MPNGPFAVERSVAELAVLRAVQLIKHDHGRNSQDIPNHNGSPVAVSSFVAQALIVAAIKETFPNDRFVCQEDSSLLRANSTVDKFVYKRTSSIKMEGMVPGQFMASPKSPEEMHELLDVGKGGTEPKGRFWVVDPIDGTFSYLVGEQWAIAVCLVIDGVEIVSAVACPNLKIVNGSISETDVDAHGMGILFSAEKDYGAGMRTLDNISAILPTRKKLRPVAASMNPEHPVIVASTYSHAMQLDVAEETADRLGSQYPNINIWSSHVRYIALIVGGGDFFVRVPLQTGYKPYIWDHAGSHLIFTELGGIVTDLDGKRIDFSRGRRLESNRGMVAARAEVFDRVYHAVKRTIAEAKRPPRGQSYYVPYDEPLGRTPLIPQGFGPDPERARLLENRMFGLFNDFFDAPRNQRELTPGQPLPRRRRAFAGRVRRYSEQGRGPLAIKARRDEADQHEVGQNAVDHDEEDQEQEELDQDESRSRTSIETVRPDPCKDDEGGTEASDLEEGAAESRERTGTADPDSVDDKILDKDETIHGEDEGSRILEKGDGTTSNAAKANDDANHDTVDKTMTKTVASEEPIKGLESTDAATPVENAKLEDALIHTDTPAPTETIEPDVPSTAHQEEVVKPVQNVEDIEDSETAQVQESSETQDATVEDPSEAVPTIMIQDDSEAKPQTLESSEEGVQVIRSTEEATDTTNNTDTAKADVSDTGTTSDNAPPSPSWQHQISDTVL